MKEGVGPEILWILGVLVVILTALVGAIYNTIRKDQSRTEGRVEIQRVEFNNALEKNKTEIDKEIHDIWTSLNALNKLYHNINTKHIQWCQKHEDQIKSVIDKFPVMESKLKGQGDMFNTIVTDLQRVVKGIKRQITKLSSKKLNNEN